MFWLSHRDHVLAACQSDYFYIETATLQAGSALQLPLWSPVIENQLYAYSAHWEIRALHGMRPPFVRLFTTSRNFSYEPELRSTEFICRFHFLDASRPAVDVKGIWAKIEDEEGQTYPEFYISMLLCPASDWVQGGCDNVLPSSVSIQCEQCQNHWTYEVST